MAREPYGSLADDLSKKEYTTTMTISNNLLIPSLIYRFNHQYHLLSNNVGKVRLECIKDFTATWASKVNLVFSGFS